MPCICFLYLRGCPQLVPPSIDWLGALHLIRKEQGIKLSIGCIFSSFWENDGTYPRLLQVNFAPKKREKKKNQFKPWPTNWNKRFRSRTNSWVSFTCSRWTVGNPQGQHSQIRYTRIDSDTTHILISKFSRFFNCMFPFDDVIGKSNHPCGSKIIASLAITSGSISEGIERFEFDCYCF